MAIGYVALVEKCCPQHLHMGITKMKLDKEIKAEGKQRSVNKK